MPHFLGVVGRTVARRVHAFLEAGVSSRALVLGGEAGIGKTTLWEAGADLVRELGLRVLVARPSGAEARLSFAALIDLVRGSHLPGGACTRWRLYPSSTDRWPPLRDRSLSDAAA